MLNRLFTLLALAAALSGCAADRYSSSDTSSGSSSGVTIYGDIDASIGRVR